MPYDSLVDETTLGPPNVPALSYFDSPHAYGPVIRPTEDVLLYGVRWWRIGWNNPGDDSTVSIGAWVDGETTPLGQILLSGPSPTETGWYEYLFDTPIPLTSGVDYLIGIGIGRDDDLAHSPNHFPVGQPSRGGLYTLQILGRYSWDPPDTTAPPAIADTVWHWLDPLVEAADASPSGETNIEIAIEFDANGEAPPVAPADGTTDLGIQIAFAAQGEAPDVPMADGTSNLSIAVVFAAAGEAPDVPMASGATNLGVRIEFAAQGEAPDVPMAFGATALAIEIAFGADGDAPVVPPSEGSVDLEIEISYSAAGYAPVAHSRAPGARTLIVDCDQRIWKVCK